MFSPFLEKRFIVSFYNLQNLVKNFKELQEYPAAP
jgi:hypothetical protein